MQDTEQQLDYVFKNKTLLEEALTHSSCVNEDSGRRVGRHNERLEFLGDAVLELCVSDALFARFPNAREGELTRMRAGLVNTRVLAEMAKSLRLDSNLRLGRGEEAQGGRSRAPLLADLFEAVLGAIYLDGGQSAAERVVRRLFDSRWPTASLTQRRKDYKTQLQEATQRLEGPQRGLPLYIPDGCEGPEHARIFAVIVGLPDGQKARATGVSRRSAEQEAARLALELLQEAPAKAAEPVAVSKKPDRKTAKR